MQFLLDTHSFLWFIGGNRQLSSTARSVIADIENEVFISIVSLWESAIKISLNKLALNKPFEELIPEQLLSNEIKTLSIDISAIKLLIDMPYHHRDPFDRLIIAQAITNNLPIITKDSTFASYPVDLIW